MAGRVSSGEWKAVGREVLDHLMQGLRPQQVVLLTFERPAVVRAGDCLLAVSVSSALQVD